MPVTAPGMLIDGKWIERSADATTARSIQDPSTGQTYLAVPEATPDEVSAATSAARHAFDDRRWSALAAEQRAARLRTLADRVRAAAADLAAAECRDVGKPIAQAREDVQGAAEILDYYAALILDFPGTVTRHDDNQLSYAVREPVGVVAAITPWNYPLVLAVQAIAPALASGCSVVLKPSELTPATAISLANMAMDLFPAGVLNLLLGDGETVGEALVRDPHVNAVLFTGSTTVGASIMRHAADSMKRVCLELGGKSPTIVMADAPFDAAVANALKKITVNQGENCGAGSRLLVQDDIAERFLDALYMRAGQLVIGNPKDERVDLGPMISAEHKDRVTAYTKVAAEEGSRLFELPVPDAVASRGHYVPLTIWDCGPGTRLWREEVFGPVLTVRTFHDDDEAVALANDSDYGLMAGIWTSSQGRGMRMAHRINAGVIRINQGAEPMQGPWGGFKRSGIGRSSGRYGLEAVTELKHINVGLAATPFS